MSQNTKSAKHRPLTTKEAPLKQWWTFYVSDNPMKIEIQRIIRRFFTFGGGNQGNAAVFGLLLLIFGILMVSIVNSRGYVSPMIVLGLYTILMFLLNPILFHSTIAGERERRSWDMLLVAPVTHGQIIVGKILAGFMLNVGVLVLLALPMLIAAITYERTHWAGLILMTLACLSAMLSCAAGTVLLSARAKRPLVSLGTSLGMVLIIYMLLPALTASVGAMDNTSQILFVWHPFTLFSQYSQLEALAFQRNGLDGVDQAWVVTLAFSSVTAIVFHLFLALVLAVWSIKTLVFADNEVRFIGRGPKGAVSDPQ